MATLVVSANLKENPMRILFAIFLSLFLASSALAQAISFGDPRQTIAVYKYVNIVLAAPTTTTVKSGSGVLHTVCINTPAATETITIYDNTAGSGTKIGTITIFASTNPCFAYDIFFATGLTLVTATAASDITVSYY